jgi:serine/threonine-protein kinase
MSPERTISGYKVDGRADIFSLGVVLYRLATGNLPFIGESTASLFQSMAKDKPVPVSQKNKEIPESLSKLIDKMMEKKPANRPANATEVAEALEAIELKLRQELTPEDEETQLQMKLARAKFWLTCSLIGNVVLITLLIVLLILSVM